MKASRCLCFTVFFLFSCAQHSSVEIDVAQSSAKFLDHNKDQHREPLAKKWWQSFDNSELSVLIEQGLADNLTLSAQSLILKSRAIDAEIADLALYPDLNLSLSGQSDIDKLSGVDAASLGISSSWELDFWGRIGAIEQKAQWQYQQQLALYQARSNLVAGSIANAWLGLIAEYEKKQVLANQYNRTKDALHIISRRFAMGKSSVTNIWQQQKLLKSIEISQAVNHAEIIKYKQTLSLWLGVPTEAVTMPKTIDMPALPSMPELGIPAETLKHRPDIKQAFAKVKAANEDVAIAIANRYPRITMNAGYFTSKNTFNSLFDDWSGNLIASLTLPLIDNGERKAIVEKRKLELQAMLMEYQQTWLEAMVSVNEVLITEAQLVTTVNNLADQLDLAMRTEKLISIQYLNGKTNYLDLLRAQESILSLERQFIDANKRIIANRVLLYRELSHGDFAMTTNQLNNPDNSSDS